MFKHMLISCVINSFLSFHIHVYYKEDSYIYQLLRSHYFRQCHRPTINYFTQSASTIKCAKCNFKFYFGAFVSIECTDSLYYILLRKANIKPLSCWFE